MAGSRHGRRCTVSTQLPVRVRRCLTLSCQLCMPYSVYAPDYVGAAVWNGLHTRDAWYSLARTCHETALSHCVRFDTAPTRTLPVVRSRWVALARGGADTHPAWWVARTVPRESTSGVGSVSRHSCAGGLCLPLHGLHDRPRATAQQQRSRWVTDLRTPQAACRQVS